MTACHCVLPVTDQLTALLSCRQGPRGRRTALNAHKGFQLIGIQQGIPSVTGVPAACASARNGRSSWNSIWAMSLMPVQGKTAQLLQRAQAQSSGHESSLCDNKACSAMLYWQVQ